MRNNREVRAGPPMSPCCGSVPQRAARRRTSTCGPRTGRCATACPAACPASADCQRLNTGCSDRRHCRRPKRRRSDRADVQGQVLRGRGPYQASGRSSHIHRCSTGMWSIRLGGKPGVDPDATTAKCQIRQRVGRKQSMRNRTPIPMSLECAKPPMPKY